MLTTSNVFLTSDILETLHNARVQMGALWEMKDPAFMEVSVYLCLCL